MGEFAQSHRPSYIKEWWTVVNWAKVSEYYEKYASKGKPVVCDLCYLLLYLSVDSWHSLTIIYTHVFAWL